MSLQKFRKLLKNSLGHPERSIEGVINSAEGRTNACRVSKRGTFSHNAGDRSPAVVFQQLLRLLERIEY
jgi:hypothetical protein